MFKLNLNRQARQSAMVALLISMAWSGSALADTADAVTGGDIPGTFKLPGTNTSIGFYGYVELDATKDFNSSNSGTFYDGGSVGISGDPSGINSDARKGGFNMTASTSRFGFKSYTPTEAGKITTVLEGDFMGSSGTVYRLRHAYGVLDADWGSLLAGQTWTLFKSGESLSETVDFNGQGADVSLRKPQIRYTTPTKSYGAFAAALEVPAYDSSAVTNSMTKAPAVTAAWTKSGAFGAMSVRAILNPISFDSTNDSTATDTAKKTKWGHAASIGGNFKVGGSDSIQAIVTAGTGISQYMESANYNPEVVVDNEIEMNTAIGYTAGWQHKWSPKWRSNLSYGVTQLGNKYAEVTDTVANKRIDTGFINTIYQMTSKTSIGLEFAHGTRKLTDGSKGKLDRITTAFHYDF